MKRPIVSYAITVYNEDKEVDELISLIIRNKHHGDEIVVVTDEGHTTQAVHDVLNKRRGSTSVFSHPLNKDFASHKNFLTSVCRGVYVFNIDADEIPSAFLIQNLHSLLNDNPTCDLFWVPRINIVEGLTDEYIKKWHWQVNEKGWNCFPDWQGRIYRNLTQIYWINKVHEHLKGFIEYAFLPQEEEYALFHKKTLSKQIEQNNLYETI